MENGKWTVVKSAAEDPGGAEGFADFPGIEDNGDARGVVVAVGGHLDVFAAAKLSHAEAVGGVLTYEEVGIGLFEECTDYELVGGK